MNPVPKQSRFGAFSTKVSKRRRAPEEDPTDAVAWGVFSNLSRNSSSLSRSSNNKTTAWDPWSRWNKARTENKLPRITRHSFWAMKKRLRASWCLCISERCDSPSSTIKPTKHKMCFMYKAYFNFPSDWNEFYGSVTGNKMTAMMQKLPLSLFSFCWMTSIPKDILDKGDW